VRYCDYLHGSVLLIGSAALTLLLVSAGSLAWYGSSLMISVSVLWLVICVACGLWLGRGTNVQEPVRELLSRSRPVPIFPKIEPPAILLSRLWPVLAITLLAAISSYWFPQLAVAACGYGALWSLAWRKQSDAVLAIEERDLVHFWIVRGSPLKSPRLVRVPAV
jgi:hypothetical protein